MSKPVDKDAKAARKKRILDAIAQGASFAKAAEAGGICRQNLWAWRQADPEFDRAVKEAVETGTDRIEDEALRRAVEGVNKPVFQRCKVVGYVTEYSDRLLEMLLRARRSEKYRERYDHSHSGPDGGPIRHEHGIDAPPRSETYEEWVARRTRQIDGEGADAAAVGAATRPPV